MCKRRRFGRRSRLSIIKLNITIVGKLSVFDSKLRKVIFIDNKKCTSITSNEKYPDQLSVLSIVSSIEFIGNMCDVILVISDISFRKCLNLSTSHNLFDGFNYRLYGTSH